MQGFVTKPKTNNLSCTVCLLYKTCKTPRMIPFGNFKRGIMNIGEAPGEQEDAEGKPWQGKMGRVLFHKYRELGIDLFEDCININALRCRPSTRGANRAPTAKEINCCRQYVIKNIIKYQPKVIILLGNVAITSVIGERWKRDLGTITKWRGWTIPDQDYKAWICPTFHPSYVERSKDERRLDINTIWTNDLRQAFTILKNPFPPYEEPTIDVVDDLSVLRNSKLGTQSMMVMPHVAIDYETTGLKPHAAGHRIVCAAVADSVNHAYVFMMPATKEGRRPFLELLANPKIAKMAHNMKFEEVWSVVRLRQPVVNWAWDSMLAAHVLDNRRGITSLKFQTYVHFGIVDYANEVAPYLKAINEKNANSINKVPELVQQSDGVNKLLHYCGLDAVYEYKLAMKQHENILEV